jgi:hypothetical protein
MQRLGHVDRAWQFAMIIHEVAINAAKQERSLCRRDHRGPRRGHRGSRKVAQAVRGLCVRRIAYGMKALMVESSSFMAKPYTPEQLAIVSEAF